MAASRLLLLLLLASSLLTTGSSSHEISNLQECEALLQLAGNLNLATNCNCTFPSTQAPPPNWTLCNARCFASSPSPPHSARCDAHGYPVRELHLSKLGLQGNISWVESFKHAKLLDLSVNNFSGSIPPALWRLAELTHANFSFNRFNGSLKFNGSIASRVQALDFSHNSFVGDISHSLCASLPNLAQLNLSSNKFSGYMNLSLCNTLESLDASVNKLQGPSFNDFGSHNSVKAIDLKQNYLLNGSIPNLSRFPRLVYLDISFNKFSGKFGYDTDDLPSNLSTLNVSHNHLLLGVSRQIVNRFGLPSFWPNEACAGCFPAPPAVTAKAPSASSVSFPWVSVHHHQRKKLDMIIAVVTGGVCAMIIIAIACCLCIRKRDRNTIWPPHGRKRPPLPSKHITELGPFFFESQSGSWIADVKDPSSVPMVIFQKPLLNSTFADLLSATKSFDKEFEVSDCAGLAYACVVPGVVADNAKVAIKLIEQGRSLSNAAARAAFTAMGELKHDNLVPLLGYCIVGEEKLLIYKHIEGGSLEEALHAVPEGAPLLESRANTAMAEDWCYTESWEEESKRRAEESSSKACLDWKTRHEIALGVARALAYLHNGYRQPIVHGAVSSSCILLNLAAEEVRLASYGGAWGLPRQPAAGYLAPDCRQSAQTAAMQLPSALKCRESVQVVAAYSSKCDVYAMGVVLLELATGKPAVGNYSASLSGTTLVAWVRSAMKGKNSSPARAVDPKLQASAYLPQLVEMMKVGYLCTADSPSKRPSMQQVVGLLKDLDHS